jgi:hypothetical protein
MRRATVDKRKSIADVARMPAGSSMAIVVDG